MASLAAADLFNVKDMVFVITGGGSGIGTMMANALDQNGAAKVYILGRRMEKLEEVAKAAKNGSIVPIQADVTSTEDLKTAASRIKSEVGFVNTVIANTGITGPTNASISPMNPANANQPPSIADIQSTILATPQSEFTNTFAVNNTGTFYTCIAFLGLLDAGNKSDAARDRGVKSQFVAVSSVAAFNRKSPGFAYMCSKAGMNHLVKALASYLVPYHIRCNVIAPGMYPSEMNTLADPVEGIKEGAFPQTMIPLTRAGDSQDMAGVILSLCSRAGAYYNGVILLTDGGRVSVIPSSY